MSVPGYVTPAVPASLPDSGVGLESRETELPSLRESLFKESFLESRRDRIFEEESDRLQGVVDKGKGETEEENGGGEQNMGGEKKGGWAPVANPRGATRADSDLALLGRWIETTQEEPWETLSGWPVMG